MAERITYHEQKDLENTLKLRAILKELPEFARDYFRASSVTTSTNTRCKYAYDMRVFFQFLLSENPAFKGKAMKDLRIEVLDQVTALDIEEYMDYLKAYKDPVTHRLITNQEKGIKRKMSSLRTFYAYYYKHEMISSNPTVLVDMPKLHKKEIVKMEIDEVVKLLDMVESGDDIKLSDHQKKFLDKSRGRDLAILSLLLGTGIRVSECVGLDIEDVDFANNGIRVVRKGGNEMIVYFGEEVENVLREYIMTERKRINPVEGHEHALFYSSQRKRIGVRTVENMVKKYSRQITTTKKITPHKLRSTFGTNLYQETGDIYLVADVLGHKDVNTTKSYYAQTGDYRRRQAAKAVHLRKD